MNKGEMLMPQRPVGTGFSERRRARPDTNHQRCLQFWPS